MTNEPEDATTEKAILTLQKHTKQSPGDLYAKGKLARYLYDLNRFDEAESVARSVIMHGLQNSVQGRERTQSYYTT